MRSVAVAGSRRVGASSGSVVVRRGGAQVSEVQRSRMLSSAVQVVSEYGYGKMSVARVTGRARVSRRTFYDFFEDREDCFLTVFDDAVARVTGLVVDAYERAGGESWQGRVRAALGVLLVFLDEQPEVGSLLVVDALRAGPRVLRRRGEVLERVSVVLDRECSGARGGQDLSLLVSEGVVGAVLSVIHTRLSAECSGSLVELLNPLMGMIVLPYQGPAAARRELERAVPEIAARVSGATQRSSGGPSSSSSSFSFFSSSSSASVSSLVSRDPLAELPMRVTYRTLRVLSAIGEQPGASNREIADHAGISDQGQISKLLGRLERLGLIHNTAAAAAAAAGQGRRPYQPSGEPNAWRLTLVGEQAREAIVQAPLSGTDPQVSGIGGSR